MKDTVDGINEAAWEKAMSTPETTEERNRETERKELTWLQTGPDRAFLYVTMPVLARDANNRPTCYATSQNGPEKERACIKTWMGTIVSSRTFIGHSVPVGGFADRYTTKRSIDCHIFGTHYVGWYYESAGNYCRLRKSKRQ